MKHLSGERAGIKRRLGIYFNLNCRIGASSPHLRQRLMLPLVTLLGSLASTAHAVTVTSPTYYWESSIEGSSKPYTSKDAAISGGVTFWCNEPANVHYFKSCSYAGIAADGWILIATNIGTYEVFKVDQNDQICPPGYILERAWYDSNGVLFEPACVNFSTTIPTPAPTPAPSPSMQIITALKPIIPTGSSVVSGKVLTRDDLALVVHNATGGPMSGASVTIQSSRSTDIVTQPVTPTDGNGETLASVETRDQPGSSTITSASSGIRTASPGNITWLPAHYENEFLITCYIIANENNFTGTNLIDKVPGLPPTSKYHEGFLQAVKIQGSGQAISGEILHYDGHGRYSVQDCALTSTQVCAVDGTTAAVDKSVIPMKGTVTIDTVGSRVAQDIGFWVVGNHIDVYFGPRKADCDAAGRRHLGVDFVNY